MEEIIKRLERSCAVSRIEYGNIFNSLPGGAIMLNAQDELDKIGNIPWAKANPGTFKPESIETFIEGTKILGPAYFAHHTADHFNTGSSHDGDGEKQAITANHVAQSSTLKKDELVENYLSHGGGAGLFFDKQFYQNLLMSYTYDKSSSMLSQNNFQFRRILFNSLIGNMKFKQESGDISGKFDSHELLNLPAKFFRPVSVVFDTKMNFVNFKNNEIEPKSGLSLPQSEIQLIERTCVLMNKLDRNEPVRL